MTAFFLSFGGALWEITLDTSFYLLFGFALAGLLHVLVPPTVVRRLLGGGRIRSILLASLIGVPLPLCSCAVLPTAVALRRKGATRGATVSFLVSTPETGIDSIAVTYGLMGWLMALFRPIAGFVSAIVAGLIVELEGGRETAAASLDDEQPLEPDEVVGLREGEAVGRPASPRAWISSGFRYGFRDLLDDLSHWLLLGLVIGAAVTAFVPATLVDRYLGRGLFPMIAMALIGIPLYICASASTPIAASLMLKGLSPGAALVLLLTGPSTNISSLVVLSGYLGKRVVAIYVTVVAVMAVGLGVLLDLIIGTTGIKPTIALGQSGGLPAWLSLAAVLVFVPMLLSSVARAPVPWEFMRLSERFSACLGVPVSRRGLAWVVVAVVFAAWLGTGLFVVKPGERGALLMAGRLSRRDLEPGLYPHVPQPIERGVAVAVTRARTLEVGFRTQPVDPNRTGGNEERRLKDAKEGYFLTGDENIIDINLTVEYRVSDAVAFEFGIADPEALVRAAARSAMVESVGSRPIDDVYTASRLEVENQVRDLVQSELDRYGAGIRVGRVSLLDVHAPTLVHWAFRDVASAREDGLTAVQAARGYEEETIPKARGDAARESAEAEAARVTEVARAGAEADGFVAQALAFASSRDVSGLRLYLETVEQVLPGIRKVVRPGTGSGKDLDLWMLPGAAAATSPRPGASAAATSAVGDAQPESPFLQALKRSAAGAAGQGK